MTEERNHAAGEKPRAAETAAAPTGYAGMPNDPKTFEHRSTRVTGNDPASGADPGGTHSTHPGQRDKAGPKDDAPELDQHVTSGDRNPTRESRLPRPPRRP